jgi:hypothetical protein
MLNYKKSALIAAGLGLTLATSSASGAALVYEPFDDLDSTLAGNTPGTGLSGTWISGDGTQVGSGSLSYGSLETSGGRVIGNTGTVRFPKGSISPGSTLSDAGLLADGASLWFSVLIVNAQDIPDSGQTDNRTYVSFGTGGPDGFDRVGGNTGSGFTIALSKNAEYGVTAQGWNDNSDGAGGAGARGATEPVTPGATFLAVGKITWGAFNVDPLLATPDVFELYLPGTDLVLPDDPISVVSKNFDQLGLFDTQGLDSAANNLFDTIGFAGARGVNGVPEIDEIRFGATYADVTPVPEPGSLALLGLGGLLIARRRRG